MPYKDKHSQAALDSQRRSAKKSYYKNREACIARAAAWNKAHPERLSERGKLWRRNSLVNRVLFNNAKQRARKYGIDFSITPDDIDVPERCPVLGLTFAIGAGSAKDNSPSIDRINPHLGYAKGNIQVISHKANTIKSDASLAELRAVVAYMERHLG